MCSALDTALWRTFTKGMLYIDADSGDLPCSVKGQVSRLDAVCVCVCVLLLFYYYAVVYWMTWNMLATVAGLIT